MEGMSRREITGERPGVRAPPDLPGTPSEKETEFKKGGKML